MMEKEVNLRITFEESSSFDTYLGEKAAGGEDCSMKWQVEWTLRAKPNRAKVSPSRERRRRHSVNKVGI